MAKAAAEAPVLEAAAKAAKAVEDAEELRKVAAEADAAQKTETKTIIGASVGGVVFVGLVVFVVMKFKKKKSKK